MSKQDVQNPVENKEQAPIEKIDYKSKLFKIQAKYYFSLTTSSLDKKIKEESNLKNSIENEIKSIAEDNFILGFIKKSKLKKFGKTRDNIINDIEKTKEIIKKIKNGEDARSIILKGGKLYKKTKSGISDYYNSKVSAMSLFAKNMLIDKKYAGKTVDEMLEIAGYKIDNPQNKKAKEKEENDKAKQKSKIKSNVSEKLKSQERAKVKVETNKKYNNFKINAHSTITPEKVMDTNEKIYDYLIKLGEVDIANYVLDIITSPDNKKVSNDQNFDNENIKKLSVINNNILNKLTEIEKNRVNEQDTSVQNKESKIQQAGSDIGNAKVPSINEDSDSSTSWLSSLLNLVLGGGAISMLKKLISFMGKRGWAFLMGILESGWEFLDKQILQRILPWIEDKVSAIWEKTINYVAEGINATKKFVIETAEKMVNGAIEMFQKSMQWITDLIKKIPYVGEIIEKSTEFIEKSVEATKSGISKLGSMVESGAEIASKNTAKIVDMVSEKTASLTKLAGKDLMKKLPALGWIAGLGFAAEAAADGDFTGASLEAASGILGSIPGWGTAASLALDAMIIARKKDNIMDFLEQKGAIERNVIGDSIIKDWNEIKKLSSDDLKKVVEYNDWDDKTKEELNRLLLEKNREDAESFATASKTQTSAIAGSRSYGLNAAGTAETYFEPGKPKKYSSDLKSLEGLSVEGYTDIKERIKKSEGLILHPYKDSRGFWTIGYGHLMVAEDGDFNKYPMGQDITKEQAEAIFEADFAKHYKGASNIPGFSEQPDGVKNALIDMTYNMGDYWYQKWPNFMRDLKAGDYKSAAQNILDSSYAKQVGDRARMNAKLISMAGDNISVYKKENETQKSIEISSDMRDDTGAIKSEYQYLEVAKSVGESKKLEGTLDAYKTTLSNFIKKNPQSEDTGKWINGEFKYNDENVQAQYKSITGNLNKTEKAVKYLKEQENLVEQKKSQDDTTEATKKTTDATKLSRENKTDKESQANLDTVKNIENIKKETAPKPETNVSNNNININNNGETIDNSIEDLFIIK